MNNNKNDKEIQIRDEDGKYHIDHDETNIKELSVTIVKAISKITNTPINKINLKNHLNLDALNNLFQNQHKKTKTKTKIILNIQNHKIKINNQEKITIKPKTTKK